MHMSELQIYLIVVGAVVILLLLVFNWWQDRRVRRRMQANMPVIEQDPLLGEGTAAQAASRQEPGLGSASLSQAQVLANAVAFSHPLTVADQEEADQSSEVVIEISFQGPMAGVDLLQLVQPLRTAGRKAVRVFAQDVAGHLSLRIEPEASYVSVQLAVLLANRSGPLSAIEWSQIWNRAHSLADQLECTIEGPDQQTVLQMASRLDDLCAGLDMQVGLTLLLGSTRPVQDVTSAARNMGFVPMDGRLAWLGDHGMVCFTLSRADAASFDAGMAGVDRLSLLLDVPSSPAEPRAFGRMVDVGIELGQRIGGELVDDQGRALQPGAEVAIDERLQLLCKQLQAMGFEAASPRARRVFA
jgi:hypothetical protein